MTKKLSVSPIIYNNGNRNITIKLDKKEVLRMAKVKGNINEERNKLILQDNELIDFILATMVNSTDKEQLVNYSNNDFMLTLIQNNHNNMRDRLLSVLKEIISDNVINDTIKYYCLLMNNEAKGILFTISRLLYLQDKHKDNQIGQDIDKAIKEWLELIKTVKYEDLVKQLDTKEPLDEETYKQYNAISFNEIVPSANINIYRNLVESTPFLSLYDNGTNDNKAIIDYFKQMIKNLINDAHTYNRFSDKIIHPFINDSVSSLQLDLFQDRYKEQILKLQEQVKNDKLKGNTKLDIKNSLGLYELQTKGLFKSDEVIDYIKQDDYLNGLYELFLEYQEEQEYKDLEETKKDIIKWHDKADTLIKEIENLSKEPKTKELDLNYVLDHLAYNDYQKETYRIEQQDNRLLQATSKQLKAIDNARGGLVTYNETDKQSILNTIKEKTESYQNTHIKTDKQRLKKEIDKLKVDLEKAEIKEKELKEEYKNVCDYLENIYKSMANEPKTSSYYKQLKKQKKEQEQRKKELERIIHFNGWQLDIWGNGNYELILNKRKNEKLRLSIENLSKQIAKYTKEEQDLFDYLVSTYLHNTKNNKVKFTLREYEKAKNRVKPTNYLFNDIQAIRLLFREVWTYITTDDNSYSFNEKHLFDNLSIKGELETDLNNLDNANLDTEISLELTETLQTLLKDHDNFLYISTPNEILQLNNDKEYLAKRLIKYLNYLARVNKSNIIEVTLDTIIEELQHYGLKKFNMLDRHKTYKTEIVDELDKALSILEGENHLNKKFIEVLDRQAFINYDSEYRGKSQETSINEWGKHKIKIQVFNLDENKLLDTKQKHKKKATKK